MSFSLSADSAPRVKPQTIFIYIERERGLGVNPLYINIV